jgi:D-3-phosphoglycerate dehydrogenase
MPHVLVAGRIHPSGKALLAEAPGVTFDLVDDVSTASYAPLVGRADAILIRTQPMPAEVIAEAGRLQIVSRHGVGYDAVDLAALNARGIPLAVVGDVNSGAVAEHTIMLLLALAKRAVIYDAAIRNGDWNRRNNFEATELTGKTLLLFGFGRIGRQVARFAHAFGMRVLVHDLVVPAADVRDSGAIAVSDLTHSLGEADFVSVHVPRTGDRPQIGAQEMALMKPTAFIVNTARGGIVDEDALADAIEAGRLAGAGFDVFVEEPPAVGHRLLASDKVIVSPHVAGLTAECTERMSVAAVRNILDYFEDRLDPRLVVNAAQIDAARPRPSN